jgi:hypothetical protein
LRTVEVHHNYEIENDGELALVADSDNEYGEHLQDQENSVESLTRFLALFILKTKEMNQLSQQALNAIVSNTEDIVEQSLDNLKTKVTCCLHENGIQPEEVQGLDTILHDRSDFAKACEILKTEYLQIKYFVEKFHLVVSILSGILVLGDSGRRGDNQLLAPMLASYTIDRVVGFYLIIVKIFRIKMKIVFVVYFVLFPMVIYYAT